MRSVYSRKAFDLEPLEQRLLLSAEGALYLGLSDIPGEVEQIRGDTAQREVNGGREQESLHLRYDPAEGGDDLFAGVDAAPLNEEADAEIAGTSEPETDILQTKADLSADSVAMTPESSVAEETPVSISDSSLIHPAASQLTETLRNANGPPGFRLLSTEALANTPGAEDGESVTEITGINRWWGFAGEEIALEVDVQVQAEGDYNLGIQIDGLYPDDWQLTPGAVVTVDDEPQEYPFRSLLGVTTPKSRIPDLEVGGHTLHVRFLKAPEEYLAEEVRFILDGPGDEDAEFTALFISERPGLSSVEGLQFEDGFGQPIPVSDLGSLTNTFAPTLYFNDGEHYSQPVTVETSLGNASLIGGTGAEFSGDINDFLSLGEADTVLDLPGESPAEYRPTGPFAPEGPPTVYSSVVSDVENNRLAIHYWFHYSYSNWKEHGGTNSHEGDWESIAVFLERTSSGSAFRPVSVGYSQHEQLISRDIPVDVELDGGQRVAWFLAVTTNPTSPNVFVGLGGHASYYNAGVTTWQLTGGKQELHRGDGAMLEPGDYEVVRVPTLDEAGGNGEAEDDWLLYPGRWGQRDLPGGAFIEVEPLGVSPGNDGPRGPATSLRWADPWSWAAPFDYLSGMISELVCLDQWNGLQKAVCQLYNDISQSEFLRGVLEPALSKHGESFDTAMVGVREQVELLIDQLGTVTVAGGFTVSIGLQGEVEVGLSSPVASFGADVASLFTGYNLSYIFPDLAEFSLQGGQWKLSRGFEFALGVGRLAGEFSVSWDDTLFADAEEVEEVTVAMSGGLGLGTPQTDVDFINFVQPGFDAPAPGAELSLEIASTLDKELFLREFVEQDTLIDGFADLFIPYVGDTWWQDLIHLTRTSFTPVLGLGHLLDPELALRKDTPLGILVNSPSVEISLKSGLGLSTGVWLRFGGEFPFWIGEAGIGLKVGAAIFGKIEQEKFKTVVQWRPQGPPPLSAVEAAAQFEAFGIEISGATIITHGFQVGNKWGDSLMPLAEAVQQRTNGWLLDYDVPGEGLTGYFDPGKSTLPKEKEPGGDQNGGNGSNRSGEVILLFDWAPGSNELASGWGEAAGDALFNLLIQLGLVNPAQVSLHFIAHSFGSAVTSEAVERLARFDIPVDQVTYLDPHDFVEGVPVWEGLTLIVDEAQRLHELGIPQFGFEETLNYGATVWENVAFSDVYYQTQLLPEGRPIPGAYNVFLDEAAIPEGVFPHSYIWNEYYLESIINPSVTDRYGYSRLAEGESRRPDPTFYGGAQDHEHTHPALLDAGLSDADRAAVTQARPPPRWDPFTIFNGDFEKPTPAIPAPPFVESFKGIQPGWSHHGGGGPGLILKQGNNHFLQLKRGASSRVHNQFYVPGVLPGETAAGHEELLLAFEMSTVLPSANDRLIVELGDTTIGDLSLARRGFQLVFLSIPEALRDRVQSLSFRIQPGGGVFEFLEGSVLIDDVRLLAPFQGRTGDVIEVEPPAGLFDAGADFQLAGMQLLQLQDNRLTPFDEPNAVLELEPVDDQEVLLKRFSPELGREQTLGKLVLSLGEDDPQAFGQTGRFYFVPSTDVNLVDPDLLHPGFQGVLAVVLNVDGQTRFTLISVRPGYSTDGPNRVVAGTDTEAVFRGQQRLRFLGFPDPDGQPLEVDGILGPRTEHAIGLFNAAVTAPYHPHEPADTIDPIWINEANAPYWVEFEALPSALEIFRGENQLERWGTSWAKELVETVVVEWGEQRPVEHEKISFLLTGVSLKSGGFTNFHQTHQAGMDLDIDTSSSECLPNGMTPGGEPCPFAPFFLVREFNGQRFVGASEGRIFIQAEEGVETVEPVSDPESPDYNLNSALTVEEVWNNRDLLEQLQMKDDEGNWLLASPPDYDLELVRSQLQLFLAYRGAEGKQTPGGVKVDRIFYNDPRTWDLEGVAFSPHHNGHFHVEVLAPEPGVITEDQRRELQEGTSDFVNKTETLRDLGHLAEDLPLTGIEVGEGLDFADDLDRGLLGPMNGYFEEDDTPTVPELIEAMKEPPEPPEDGEVQIDPDGVGGGVLPGPDGPEMRFDTTLVFTHVQEGIPLDWEEELGGLGLTVDVTSTVDVTTRLEVTLSFGLNLDPDLPPDEMFFIQISQLKVEVELEASNIEFEAQYEFINVRIENGSLDLSAALTLIFNRQGKITRSDLQDQRLVDLVQVEPPVSRVEGVLPISASIGDVEITGESNPRVIIEDDDLFSAPGPVFRPEGFEELLDFSRMGPRALLALLKQVRAWMDQFGDSAFADNPVPFTEGTTFADLLDAGGAFGDRLIDSLEDENGQPNFRTAQELAERLAGAAGLDYDPATRELTYQLEWVKAFEPVTVPIELELADSSLADVRTESVLTLTPSLAFDVTLGIDLAPGEGESDVTRRLFLKDTSLTGQLDLAIEDFDALARFGFVGVEILNGSGEATAELSLALQDPGTESADGRIQLVELWDGLADFGDLVAPMFSGSAQMTLPVRAHPNFLGAAHPPDPQLEITWPDITNPGSLQLVPNEDMEALLNLEHMSFQILLAQLRKLEGFIEEQVERRDNPDWLLNRKLPVADRSFNETVDLSGEYSRLLDLLEANEEETIQAVKDRVAELFDGNGGAPSNGGSEEPVSLEERVLQLNLDFAKSISQEVPVNLDLADLIEQLPENQPARARLAEATRMVDAGANAQLAFEIEASLQLGVGLDLSGGTPELFLSDETGVQINIKFGGDDLQFRAALGPLGIFVGSDLDPAGVRLDRGSDPPGTVFAERAPAFFRLGLEEDPLDHRYALDELSVDLLQPEVTGRLLADFPIYFPVKTQPIANPTDGDGDGVPDHVLHFEVDLEKLIQGEPDAVDLATPNIQLQFDAINLLQNLGVIVEGLDLVLGGVQSALDARVFSQKLPLVGDQLKEGARFIERMRTEFVRPLADRLEGETALEVIQEELFIGLGPQGLDLLGDLDEDGDIDRDDVRPTVVETDENGGPSEVEAIQIDLLLHRQATLLAAPIAFDLGLPALGLDVESEVQVEAGFQFRFGFGVSRSEGFYFVTDPQNESGEDVEELTLEFSAAVPELEATGRLAFLQLDVSEHSDPNLRTHFRGAFDIDLLDPNSDGRLNYAEISSGPSFRDLVQARLNAEAEVNLHLLASFGGDANFPSINSDFHLDWQFDRVLIGEGPETLGSRPNIAFNNIELNVGEFFTRFARPILEKVQEILGPVKPVVDLLTAPLPVLSDLGPAVQLLDEDGSGDVTLVELIQLFSEDARIADFLEAFAQAIAIVESIPTTSQNLVIPLGGFEIGKDLRGVEPEEGGGLTLEDLDATETDPTDELARRDPEAKEFVDELNDAPGGGIQFPFLQDPASVFELFIGGNPTLFLFDMPELSAGFTFTPPPIGPLLPPVPLFARFMGRLSVEADFSFGYDTFGLRQLFAQAPGERDPAVLLDGFFVLDTDETGRDVPEVTLRGGVEAAGELGVVVASAGVSGGIFADVEFNLNDPDGDSRVRVNEIVSNFQRGPLCIFDLSGGLTAGLNAFVKVLTTTRTLNLVTVDLLDFDFACPEDPAEPDPILATPLGGGVLRLNMGPQAMSRQFGDLETVDEKFKVEPGEQPGTVVVRAFGFTQEYNQVSRIIADGGDGKDQITIHKGLTVAVELSGGADDDRLIGGSGPAVLRGGGGNDVLSGGESADQLFGEAGDDLLVGNAGDDQLIGGEGDDVLEGGAGNDVLQGQAGDDLLSGGEGRDQMEGGSGADDLSGGADDDRLQGQTGRDILDGGAGSDQLIGSQGDDRLFGQSGDDLLEGGDQDDHLEGGDGNDELNGGPGADFVTGGPGNDRIKGSFGDDMLIGDAGDDMIEGGSGNDEIDGGAGADQVDGGLGNDRVRGGSGSDTVIGGLGADTVMGGASRSGGGSIEDENLIYGDAIEEAGGAADRIYGDHGMDTIHGGAGDDVMNGLAGDDVLFGNEGDDTLLGGDGQDSLHGESGSDLMFGGPGADLLLGGTGADELIGEAGDDVLAGQSGDDQVSGGPGSDILWGGEVQVAAAVFEGHSPLQEDGVTPTTLLDGIPVAGTIGDGQDTLDGGAGDDWVFGGGDDDTLLGSDGSDYADGGAGNDQLRGGRGRDVLRGGGNDDTLHGNAGIDQLFGDAGSDRLFGDSGEPDGTLTGQRLIGGSGEDFLHAYATSGDAALESAFEGDQIFGGPGNDWLFGNLRRERLFGEEGNDFLHGDYLSGPEYDNNSAAALTGGADELYGDQGEDQLLGGGGGDRLFGGGDTDWVEGQNGEDQLYGGSGIDLLVLDVNPDYEAVQKGETIDGHFGNREHEDVEDDLATDILVIEGTAVDDSISIAESDAGMLQVHYNDRLIPVTWRDDDSQPLVEQFRISGLEGNDQLGFDRETDPVDFALLTQRGRDFVGVLDGGPGADTLHGSSVRDRLDGGLGDDRLFGWQGDDRLWGGEGEDRLFAGAGNDDLIGGTGANRLYAWSRDPELGGQFGVFVDPATGEVHDNDGGGIYPQEETGLNRILGGPEADRLYGGTGLDFLFGNGGEDTLFRSDGTTFESMDNGLAGETWKQYARETHLVWYVGGSNANDVISVDFVTEPGLLEGRHLVTRLTENNGNFSFAAQLQLDFEAVDEEGERIWDAEDAVLNPDVLVEQLPAERRESLANLEEQRIDLVSGYLPPEGRYLAIVVDALEGDDQVTVGPTTQKTVWIDAGPGDDRVEILAGNAILVDQTEKGPNGARNDLPSTAYLLAGPGEDHILENTRFTGLTIDHPADIDWYRFQFSDAPGADTRLVLEPASPRDRLQAVLYALNSGSPDDGDLFGVPMRTIADRAEPNDTSETAYRLDPAGQRRIGDLNRVKGLTLDRADDVDWFEFTLDEALEPEDRLTLVNGSQESGIRIELTDDTGAMLASAEADPQAAAELTLGEMDLAPGDYRLRVSSLGGAGTYELEIALPGNRDKTIDLSGEPALDLGGLTLGQPYAVRIVSDLIPTLYDLAIQLDADAEFAAMDFATRSDAVRRDVILGGPDDDVLAGGPGEDWIFGGSGNDVLTGGKDRQLSDLLFGEAGNDLFQIIPDALPVTAGSNQTFLPALSDQFNGGPGEDRAIYYGGDLDSAGQPVPDHVAIRYNRFLHRYEFTAQVWDEGREQFRTGEDQPAVLMAREDLSVSSGRLDGVSEFSLLVDGDAPVQVTIPVEGANGTQDNQSIEDLVADLNAALEGAGLGQEVIAGHQGLRIFLATMDRGLHASLAIQLPVDDPLAGQVHFREQQSALGSQGAVTQHYLFYQTENVEGTVLDTRDGDDIVHADPGYVLNGSEWGIDPGDLQQGAAIAALHIVGGPGNDQLFGGAEADRIEGGPGIDFIAGGSGNDEIEGGPGDDTLVGQADVIGETSVGPDRFEWVNRDAESGRNDQVRFAAMLGSVVPGQVVEGLTLHSGDTGDWYLLRTPESDLEFAGHRTVQLLRDSIEVEFEQGEAEVYLFPARRVAPDVSNAYVPVERFSGVPEYYLLHVVNPNHQAGSGVPPEGLGIYQIRFSDDLSQTLEVPAAAADVTLDPEDADEQAVVISLGNIDGGGDDFIAAVRDEAGTLEDLDEAGGGHPADVIARSIARIRFGEQSPNDSVRLRLPAPLRSSSLYGSQSVIGSPGDYNGDGFSDLVIGVTLVSEAFGSVAQREGIYLLFGRESWPAEIDVATEADLVIDADYAGRLTLTHAGDLNNDGRGDLLVGDQTGAYLFFGREEWSVDSQAILDLTDADVVFAASGNAVAIQSVTAAGDVDGDGIDDAALLSNGGRFHLVYGRNNGQGFEDTYDLDQADAFLQLEEDQFSTELTVGPAGDLNEDGFAEVLITGSPSTLLIPGREWAGEVSATEVIFKSGSAQFISLGDVNGDGFADLGASAMESSPPLNQAGAVLHQIGQIYFGQPGYQIENPDLVFEPARPQFDVHAVQSHLFGSPGDLDRDGRSDLVVADAIGGNAYLFYGRDMTQAADDPTGEVERGSGKAYTYELSPPQTRAGSARMPGLDLSDLESEGADLSRAFRLEGAVANGQLAEAMSLGDINGDGIEDILVGSSSRSDARVYFVYFGPVTVDGALDVVLAAEMIVPESELGMPATRMGDINGDGASDLVFVRDGETELTITILLGGAGVAWPHRLSADWVEEHDQGPDDFVRVLSMDTDFLGTGVQAEVLHWNGDRFADLVVASAEPANIQGESRFGYLLDGARIVGGAEGLEAASATFLTDEVSSPGVQNNYPQLNALLEVALGDDALQNGFEAEPAAQLETRVIGDVNGDGLEDLLLTDAGFMRISHPHLHVPQIGRSYLFLGRSDGKVQYRLDQADLVIQNFGLAHAFRTGDVNEDGYDEFVLSRSEVNPGYAEGNLLLFYGADDPAADWSVQNQPDRGIVGVLDATLEHDETTAAARLVLHQPFGPISASGGTVQSELSVTTGDFNGDHEIDLAVGRIHAVRLSELGAVLDRDQRGRVGLFWSIDELEHDLLFSEAALQFQGEQEFDELGALPMSPRMDLDGDRLDDLLLGAAQADGSSGDEAEKAGKIYVIDGSSPVVELPDDGDSIVDLSNRTVTGSGSFLVDDGSGQPVVRGHDSNGDGLTDNPEFTVEGDEVRWYRFTFLGDGMPQNLIRLSPAAHEQRVVRVGANFNAINPALDSLEYGSFSIGGNDGLIGFLEVDLSAFLAQAVNPDYIEAASLQLEYLESALANGDRLEIRVLNEEGDGRVSLEDAAADSTPVAEFEWMEETDSALIQVDLTQAVRQAFEQGHTRLTLRLAMSNPQARLNIRPPAPVGDNQTGLLITTAPQPGVQADFISSDGVLLAEGQSLFDLRHVKAGTYYLKVYRPSPNLEPETVALSVEIAPPLAGQHHHLSDRDQLHGGDGNDLILGNAGLDQMLGQSGRDSFLAEAIEVRDAAAEDNVFPGRVKPDEHSSIQPPPIDPVIMIPDAQLRIAVAEELGIAYTRSWAGAPLLSRALRESELAEVTHLYAGSRDITDLTGIKHLANLEVLDLSNNDLTSINRLTALSRLRVLALALNYVGELDPLRELSALTRLSLDFNPTADVDVLGDLTSLEVLSADHLLPLFEADAVPWDVIRQWDNPNESDQERFGFALARAGWHLLVGSPGADPDGVSNAGAAYLVEPATGQVLLTLTIPEADRQAQDQFGSAVAAAGNRIAVGALGPPTGDGGVYVFDRRTGNLLHVLERPDSRVQGSEPFGASLGFAGHWIVVGEPGTRAVYLFDAVTGAYHRTLFSPGGESDEFGYSVTGLDGRIIVGAPGPQSQENQRGLVYVYDGQEPVLETTLEGGSPIGNDRFGHSLAAIGNRLFVGAPNDNTGHIDEQGNLTGPVNAGGVYQFDGFGNEPPRFYQELVEGVNLGESVAVLGRQVVAGAPFDFRGQRTLVFDRDSGRLMETLDPPEGIGFAEFGSSLATIGGVVAVGAPEANLEGAQDAGTVILYAGEPVTDYDYLAALPRLQWLSVRSDSIAPDSFTGAPELQTVHINEQTFHAPDLNAIPDQLIQEGSLLTLQLSLMNSSGGGPENVRFGLGDNAPEGMTLDSVTGQLNWTPSEEQGPGVHAVLAYAQQTGGLELRDTHRFYVRVDETPAPPSIASIADQTVDESNELNLRIEYADADVPMEELELFLETAPDNALLDAVTGNFTWTPDESQGPGSYSVAVAVRDSSGLQTNETFSIQVREVNAPPVAEPVSDRIVIEGETLIVALDASDPDLPAPSLSFILESAPEEARIEAGTDRLIWTPDESHANQAHEFVIQVQDDGNPALNDSISFWVTVRPNPAPEVVSVTRSDAGDRIEVRFSDSIQAEPVREAFELIDVTADQPVPAEAVQVDYDPKTFAAALTFTDSYGPALPDGDYRLRTLGEYVMDSLGKTMSRNLDHEFHVLGGDVNGDRVVNDLDLYGIWQRLQHPEGGSPAAMDVNGDLEVNASDMERVKAAYKVRLPTPQQWQRGDLNADGRTNDLDLFNIWQELRKPAELQSLRKDLNRDGRVSVGDLDWVRENYLIDERDSGPMTLMRLTDT